MNTQHTNGGNDNTLDQGLDRLGQSYRTLEQENPPDLLDQAIRNRAHRAVAEKPRWMQFGWLHGLTTAAVFVLAFTIILYQREPVTVDADLILESSPMRLRDEPAAGDQLPQVVPAAAMKPELEKSADSDPVTLELHESRKEVQLLEKVAGAPAAARQLGVSLEEEKAPRARGKAQDIEQADFASAITPLESGGDTAPADATLAEQKLAEIIRLKDAGDEDWKRELEQFRQQFPDYPLPAELQD